jgi:hypothetical protein
LVMAIQIEGTQVKKSGGGGLGSLLGKIAGGLAGVALAPVTGGGSLAAAATGMGLGGAAGGMIGGAVAPGSQKDLGIPVAGARQSGMAPPKPKTNAIDRLNSILDLGGTVAGGVNTINGLRSPKLPSVMDRRLMRIE